MSIGGRFLFDSIIFISRTALPARYWLRQQAMAGGPPYARTPVLTPLALPPPLAYPDSHMKLSLKTFLGLPVHSRSGLDLGRVSGADMDTDSGRLQTIHVKSTGW